MKLHHALWLALCVPLSAGASRFTVETPAALDLETGERRISELAEMRITASGIESAFGIRLDRPESKLAARLPLLIATRYVIRDRAGQEYRMLIRSVIGARVALEILRPGEAPAGPRIQRLGGAYRLQSFTIDGGRAATAYPDLELGEDGTYRLGGGLGRWQFDGWILSLDGYYGRWDRRTCPGTAARSASTSSGAAACSRSPSPGRTGPPRRTSLRWSARRGKPPGP